MSAYSASTHLPADPATERDPRSNRATIARLVCTAGLALLMLVNVGAWNAGLWFASVSLAELIFSRTRTLAGGPERTALQRTLHSAGVLLENAFYSWPTALLWLTGEARLQIVATCVICVQLFNASTFAYRDRGSLLVCGGPPALTMVLLTLFAGHMPLFDRLTVVLGFGLAAFYAINASRVNVGMLEKLRTTQLDLEEQTRSAMSANAAKSDFLALMSHELRTPMNGMLGMAHALRGTPLNQAQSEYLDMMVLSGGNLMAILNDILDLSKIETGKLELNAEPFDLRDAATQVFQIWSEIGAAKGVALRLDIPADAPRWLHGDVLRVRQIMLNLVSNAVKFTPEGKVTLSLATGAAGEVLIFVSDTGSGIDAETQIRLFAPFTQGSASIARRHGGTGLGLSICRKLARLMDGEISLESELGVGSTFRVTLPLPPCAPAPTLAAASDRLELEGGRVLVVEDNQVNQAVAVAILGAAGLHVVVASDGLEALERLRADAFDLVLMDVHMPRMDGVEATGRIRAGEAGRRSIPIIALTADAMTGERERLMSLGFDDLHPKPIAPAGLLASIASLLDSQTTAVEKAFA